MKPNPVALIIDNDKPSRRLLRLLLEAQHYQHYRLFESEDGTSGIAAVAICQPDVIVLELSLPDLEGLTVLKCLRQLTRSPVLVLSLCSSEADIVAALDGGASGYMTKPFSGTELLARLRMLQRHLPGELYEPSLREGGVNVDLINHLVTVNGSHINLTATEEVLLHTLLTHAGKVVPRRYLLRSVWGAEAKNEGLCLRVYISCLRKKLDLIKQGPVIETVANLGYRLWPVRAAGRG
jgi:two-component system, OmpR family, KDP operon response regulator KdpE